MTRISLAILVLVISGVCLADDSIRMTLDSSNGAIVTRSGAKPYPRLAGEFETPRFVTFGVSDLHPDHREILIQIAEKTAGRVNVMVLCNDTWQIKETTAWLLEVAEEYPHVYFCELALNTVWLRDFGPIFAQTTNGTQVLDFFYERSRPKDDRLPAIWSKRSGTAHIRVPWKIQGGNLICNGQGLALTTNRIFEDNHVQIPGRRYQKNAEVKRRKMVVDGLVKSCNLSQLVVLEPLQSELTKHVDMFATFLSPDDVLVANVDPADDPTNAQILDRNAGRLAKVLVGGKPLRVHRIQIPVREDTSWSAYTNAVIAGDVVLMPVFDSDPQPMVSAAVAAYRRLLPHHTVETIDMTSMKHLQGELHCLSLHVPAFAPLPDQIFPFTNAKRMYFPDAVK